MSQMVITFPQPQPITLVDGETLSLQFAPPQAIMLQVEGIATQGSGGIDDGDKGDITVSGGGAAWAINAGAVTDLMLSASVIALFAPTVHTHTIAQVTGLQAALDGKQPLAAVLTGTTASFTTAQETKLAGIATAATANATDAALRDRATHTGTQAAGTITGLAAVATTGSASDLGAGTLPAARFTDVTHGDRAGGTLHAEVVAAGASGFMSGADKTKLNGIATAATANATDAALRDRATHTGTQLASTISDFATAVAATAAVTANTAKVTNATHTGDVTGATALTIAADAVTNAKLANMGANTIKGAVSAGDPVDLTPAQVRTMINVADGAQVNVATDLSYTATTRLLASSTGADATLPLVTSGDAGLAPASGGGTANFLRADGTWATPAGGGGSLTVQDEGSTLSAAVTSINFTGAGVTATGATSVTVNVPGGGGATLITAAPATDQADWNPAGFGSGVGTIKLQPTTNSFLTGLLAGATDQQVTLFNDSTFVVCVEGESGASTAANRFRKTPLTMWLLPQESMVFRYSATLARWALVSASRAIGPVDYDTIMALPSNGSVLTHFGRGAAGTASVGNIGISGTPTNEFLARPAMQASTGTAAATARFQNVNAGHMRGATAGRQGFFHTAPVRFTAKGATGAVRAGMHSSGGAIAALNAVQLQCLLLGADTSMTTLRIFSGGTSAGTPVDLGANFPVPSATAAYEYCFYAPPASAFARWMVRRLDTRFVAEGTLTANIPTDTTQLFHRIEVFVGATAATNTVQANYLLTTGL